MEQTFSEFFKEKGFSTCHWEGGLIECDKGTAHNYINCFYSPEFTPKRNEEITLVEIGIFQGVSLKLWTDWLNNAKIIGIDPNKDWCYGMDYQVIGNQYNFNIIWKDGYSMDTINLFEDNSIDYLIDDGTHLLNDYLFVVKNWLPKIKSEGKIIIEDINIFEDVQTIIDSVDFNLYSKYELFDNRKTHNPIDDLMLVFTKK